MPDVDSNLVKAIAEQVMAALRGVASPAEIHAPIGQCTGDYSKFTGAQIQGAPAPSTPAPAVPTPAPAPAPTALKGVITVSHLKSIRGAVRLAKGAMLTPLAQDFIKDRGITIMTDEMAAAVAVNAGAPTASTAPVFWWIEGSCPSVAKLIEALRPALLASRERNAGDNLKSAIKEAAGLVKNKKIAGALFFVPSSARAICYANRCPSLRAVVATSDKAVADGIEFLGTNALVIEYPVLGFKAMMSLVKPFIEAAHTVPTGVQKELDELKSCG